MLEEFSENTRACWRHKEWRTFIILAYPFTLLGYLIQKGFEALFGRFYLKH